MNQTMFQQEFLLEAEPAGVRTLVLFYQAYFAWLNSGALKGYLFDYSGGLCWQLTVWCDNCRISKQERNQMLDIMRNDFIRAGMHEDFPFNDGLHFAFMRECEQRATHLNPKRIQWVKDHV